MNEPIQQARELCGKATPGPWISEPMTSKKARRGGGSYFRVAREELFVNICHYLTKHDAAFIAASRTLVPQLCDALEAAQKENEELKNILRFNMVQIHGERMTALDALSSLTARAEKAEAEIKSIHEALCFADKCRSTCTNYTELAVSNGLALGKIAVAIQHDYDAEPPKGE